MPPLIAAIGAIGTAITGALGAAGGLFTGFGGFILKTLLGIGLNLLGSLLAKKKQSKGFEAQIQIGGEIPRQVVCGIQPIRGHLVYFNSWGSSNDDLQMVYVLSDTVCHGPARMIIEGEYHDLVERTPVSNAHKEYTTEKYGDKLVIRWFDGSQTAADSDLVAHANPPERWTATDVLTGMAYVSLSFKYDKDLYKSGLPEITWIFRGSKLFDPRKAVALGGTGSHVWGDQTTYEYSENPSVILYNFLRGIRNAAGVIMVGLSAAQADLHTDMFVSAANVCEESVLLASGESEPRFRMGMTITADAEVRESVEQMVASMGGYTVERNGQFGVLPAAARTVIDTITDGDLLASNPITFSFKRGREELANAVFGQYMDPANLWQRNSYPPFTNTDMEIEDGYQRLAVTMDLPSVFSTTQAERIRNLRLYEIREQASAVLHLPYNKIWWRAGDWIEWESYLHGDGSGGTVTRTFRIVRKEIDPTTKACQYVLDQISEDVYGWSVDDEGPIVDTPVDPDPINLIKTVQNWNVSVGGDASPSLIFTWDPPNDSTITAVAIEYRQVQPDVDELPFPSSNITDSSPNDGTHAENGVQPSTLYEARATITTTPTRLTEWTAWKRAGGGDGVVTGPVTATDVLDGIIDRHHISQQFDDTLRDINETINRIRSEFPLLIADLAAALATHQGNIYEKSELVKIANEQSFVATHNEVLMRIDEDGALYEAIDEVEVLVGDVETGLTALGSIVDSTIIDITNLNGDVSVLVSQYTSLAALVTGLDGDIAGLDSDLTALASVVSGHSASIVSINGTLTIQANGIDAVEARLDTAEGDIVANALAIDVAEARVDVFERGISGTATAGSSSTITLQSGTVIPNNGLNNLPIRITAGPGVDQTRTISNYVGSTRVATVTPNWTTNPTSSSQYVIGNGPVISTQATKISSVETTVSGHTAQLASQLTSINGLSVQFSVIGSLDGATGGFIFEGVQKQDGSVVYDIILNATTITFGNFQNYIRNYRFEQDGAFTASAAMDVSRWYINFGISSVSVLANASLPSGCPAPYALALSLAGQPRIFSDFDPGVSGAAGRGVEIVSGRKYSVSFWAAGSTSSRIANCRLAVREANGTVTYMNCENSTSNRNFTRSTTWSEEKDIIFTATVSGRGFLLFERVSTSGSIYITDVYLLDMNGVRVIVPGSILAHHIGANEIDAGQLRIGGLLADSLAAGAASIPQYAVDDTNYTLNTYPTWKQILSISYTSGQLDQACRILVWGLFNLNFSGGPSSNLWEVRILADGVEIDRNGGDAVLDSCCLIGTVTRSAGGTCVVTAEVRGDATLTTTDRVTLVTQAIKR